MSAYSLLLVQDISVFLHNKDMGLYFYIRDVGFVEDGIKGFCIVQGIRRLRTVMPYA